MVDACNSLQGRFKVSSLVEGPETGADSSDVLHEARNRRKQQNIRAKHVLLEQKVVRQAICVDPMGLQIIRELTAYRFGIVHRLSAEKELRWVFDVKSAFIAVCVKSVSGVERQHVSL